MITCTFDGGPIVDDYSNLYFEGSGRMRAHVGEYPDGPLHSV